MYVRFNYVDIENFLSIGNARFDITKGITSLVGRNLTDTYSESNGSGKSSIIESIVWCLTGSTTRGISSDSVINNLSNDKGCKVEVSMSVDSDVYEVKRTRGGIGNTLSITKNGEDISGNTMKKSQSILEELIPLNYEDLTSCIILAQDMPGRFSSLTPAGRKSKLESIADYDDKIQTLNRILKDKKSELDEDIKKIGAKIVSLEEYSIPEAERNLESTKSEFETFKKKLETQEEEFAKIDAENKEIEEKINQMRIRLEEHKNEESRINELIDSKRYNIEEFRRFKIQPLWGIENDLKSQRKYREDRVKDLNKDIESLGTGICRTCKRPLDNKDEIDRHRKEIEDLIKIEDELLGYVNSQFEENSKLIASFEMDREEMEHEIQRLQSELKSVRSKSSSYEKSIDELRSQIKHKIGIEDNTEYYLNKIKESEDKIQDMKNDLEELQPLYDSKYKESKSISEILYDLSRGQFRTFLLDKTMKNFNHLLSQISLELMKDEPVRLLFNGDKIEILYKDKYYEQMSGGEKKRIDIAMELTVRKYKSLVSGVNFNLLVMDETFDSLDKIGIDSLFNAVEASGTTESFVVISHRENACLNYDRKVVVCKEEGISRISEVR